MKTTIPLFFLFILLCSCTNNNSVQNALSNSDLDKITALEEAIEGGDADKYASLCVEEVKLLHPNDPIFEGREELRLHNAAMFETVNVLKLDLTPVVVSGSGNLAYEVGTQVLAIEPSLLGFSSVRKYVHVLKRGDNGEWKFTVLMSNDSE